MTSLAGLQDIQAHNVQVDLTNHEGSDAIRVMELPGQPHGGEDKLAILPDTHFHNGLIVLDIAGSPIPGLKKQPGDSWEWDSGLRPTQPDSSVSTSGPPMGAPMTSYGETTPRNTSLSRTILGGGSERKLPACTNLMPT